ncbi:MAG: hypothetical protein AAGF20_05485 [Pseudomonadota bacterium]
MAEPTKSNPNRTERDADPIIRRYRPRLDEYEPLEHRWDAFVEVWNVIRPAWWPILVTALLMVLVLAVGQIRDVLAAMPATLQFGASSTGISGRFWTTFLSCGLFSLFAWAFGRGLLAVRFPYTPCPMDPPDWHVSLRLLIGRALGMAMPLAMAGAYFSLGMSLEAWLYIALAGALLLVYAYVKPFLKDWIYTPEVLEAEREQAMEEAEEALERAEDVLEDATETANTTRQRYLLARVADLARDAGERVRTAGEAFADVSLYDQAMPERFPRQMNILLYAIFALHMVIAVLVIWSKVLIPQALGAAAILFLSASGWMALGVFLFSYWPRYSRLPSGVLLFAVWMAVVSIFNHNHHIRLIDSTPVSAEAPRAREYVRAWLSARQAYLPKTEADSPFPVLVVAAEGGGARAAYWTGQGLSQISQMSSIFGLKGHDHILAVSGVSGGAVGTGIWGAALSTGQTLEAQASQVEAILREDFLSPVTAGTMYVDLPSDLLPFPVRAFDRAIWLEESFEAAWARHASDSGARNPLTDDFRALWQDRPLGSLGSVPLLIYNTTAVQTGRVWQVSPVRLNGRRGCQSGDFVDLVDGLGKGMRLSTAVHLSARFTGVSPAGQIDMSGYDDCFNLTRERFVDGAYFENSGADTATRFIRQAREEIEAYCEPEDGSAPICKPDKITIIPVAIITELPDPPAVSQFLHETLSIIATVANTRMARGQDSLRRMGEVTNSEVYTVELPAGWRDSEQGLGCTPAEQRSELYYVMNNDQVSRFVPLGWTLSKEAADHMCRSAKTALGLRYLSILLQSPR